MVRRALSFNRKPRRRGADGGEFTALLEGSEEDREARLLARRQATARTIERVSRAVVGVAMVSGKSLELHLTNYIPHPAGDACARGGRAAGTVGRRARRPGTHGCLHGGAERARLSAAGGYTKPWP